MEVGLYADALHDQVLGSPGVKLLLYHLCPLLNLLGQVVLGKVVLIKESQG